MQNREPGIEAAFTQERFGAFGAHADRPLLRQPRKGNMFIGGGH
jgi:hypothetical protein